MAITRYLGIVLRLSSGKVLRIRDIDSSIVFYDNFESYVDGSLAGQGTWTDNAQAQNIAVYTDASGNKAIGTDTGFTGYTVTTLPGLNPSLGFEFTFTVDASLGIELFETWLGNETYLDLLNNYSYIYLYTINSYAELENDTPYAPGDIFMMKVDGLNLTLYRNGIIDTDWYDYNDGGYDMSGDAGVFVLGSPFSWDGDDQLWLNYTHYTDVGNGKIGAIGVTYNIIDSSIVLYDDFESYSEGQLIGQGNWFSAGQGYDVTVYSSDSSGIVFYDNFESLADGSLAGQGSWVASGIGDSTVIVYTDGDHKNIGAETSFAGVYNVVTLTNLNPSLGWEYTMQIDASFGNETFGIYFGNETYLDVYPGGAYMYILTENGTAEIETVDNWEPGDILKIKYDPSSLKVYKNNVIDTSWYDYNGGGYDMTGDLGEFVLLSPYSWDDDDQLWMYINHYGEVGYGRIGAIGMTYNIDKTNSVGSDGSTSGFGGCYLPLINVEEYAGFDISFEIKVMPTSDYFYVYFTDSSYIKINNILAFIYIETKDANGELENDTPFVPGDVVMLRRRGFNITIYRNGVIDTDWYDYNSGSGDLTGDAGEFVLKSAFNWTGSHAIGVSFFTGDTSTRIDNIGMTYNI